MRNGLRAMCGVLVLGGAMLMAGCERAAVAAEKPVGQRAMEAYNAKDYKNALPLLKLWMATPEVALDKQKRADVEAYIIDVQLKLTGKVEGVAVSTTLPAPAGGTVSATPNTTISPTSAPSSLAALRAQAAMVAAQIPSGPEMGVHRVPHEPIKPGEIREMAIKEMGNFEFDPEKDTDVPADVKALSGGKVRLRGFMMPLTQAQSITDFALVPSLTNCCFGQPPGVQHVVTCRIPKNKALDYITDEVSVEGTLKVNVKSDQGYIYSIFELDVSSVKLAE